MTPKGNIHSISLLILWLCLMIELGLGAFSFAESWQVFDSTDGLPSDSVHVTSVDVESNTWFGTRRGVAKFSGSEVWVYEMEPTYMSSIADGSSDSAGFPPLAARQRGISRR